MLAESTWCVAALRSPCGNVEVFDAPCIGFAGLARWPWMMAILGQCPLEFVCSTWGAVRRGGAAGLLGAVLKFCYNWSMEIRELQLSGDSVEDVVGVLIDGGCGLVLELVVAGVWWGSCTGGAGCVLVRLVRT